MHLVLHLIFNYYGMGCFSMIQKFAMYSAKAAAHGLQRSIPERAVGPVVGFNLNLCRSTPLFLMQQQDRILPSLLLFLAYGAKGRACSFLLGFPYNFRQPSSCACFGPPQKYCQNSRRLSPARSAQSSQIDTQ